MNYKPKCKICSMELQQRPHVVGYDVLIQYHENYNNYLINCLQSLKNRLISGPEKSAIDKVIDLAGSIEI